MNIRLLKLGIKNFKGIRDFTFTPYGEDCSVSSINGKGKSTLADAWSWLCFDKDSYGNSKFGIKPTDGAGKEIHDLQHSVDADIEVQDESRPFGETLKLRKVLTENWKKKRGTSAPEFSGHITEYWIDDVPKTKTEYDAFISGMCRNEEIFRLLTSMQYFNSDAFGKVNRRRIILDIAGIVSDADVIAAHESIKELPGILGSRTLADHLKTIRANRPKVNEQIDQVKPRIDEAGRDKPTEESMMPPAGVYSDLTTGLEHLIKQRAAILSGDTSETNNKIMAFRQEIAQRESEFVKAGTEASDKRKTLNREAEDACREIERQHIESSRWKLKEDEIESKLARMRQDYMDEAARTFPSKDVICPTCHQDLPAEMIVTDEEHNAKSAEYQRLQKVRLDAINAMGAKEKEVLKEAHAARQQIAERILQLTEKNDQATKSAAAVKMPETPDSSLIRAAIEALELGLSSKETPATEEIDEQIEITKKQITDHDKSTDNRKRATEIETRIQELDALKKKLGKDLEKIDKEIALCEEFTRLKVAMLTDSVNDKFKPLSFRLFNEQINGGISDECELMMYSPEVKALVAFSGLSTGQKAVAGLTINKVLSVHHGITVPVFVDSAEGITLSLPMAENGQYVRLHADPNCSNLTVKTIGMLKEAV
jgi:hypothetical protein